MGAIRASSTRWIAAVSAALALTAATPRAGAAPFAGTIQRGTVVFNVQGADGVQRAVSLTAEKASGSETSAVLTVTISACTPTGCTEAQTFGKALDPNSFTVGSDNQTATLTTKFAGAPVSVTWNRAGNAVGVVANLAPPNSMEAGDGGSATVSGRLLGFACNGSGDLSTTATVAADRNAAYGREPKTLPAGFRATGAKKTRCV